MASGLQTLCDVSGQYCLHTQTGDGERCSQFWVALSQLRCLAAETHLQGLLHSHTAVYQKGTCTMQLCRQPQHQGRTSRSWHFHMWLSLLISLALSATARAALLTSAPATTRVVDAEASETRQDQALVETADPRMILAQAQRWHERGTPFPEARLRQAVEAALQPEASWDDIAAAITAFDV